jgi:hypothetical protein
VRARERDEQYVIVSAASVPSGLVDELLEVPGFRAQTLRRFFADGSWERALRLPAWVLDLLPEEGVSANGLLTNVAEQAGTGRYEQER